MATQRAEQGNVLVGQSGGPTEVIKASLVGVSHEALRLDAHHPTVVAHEAVDPGVGRDGGAGTG